MNIFDKIHDDMPSLYEACIVVFCIVATVVIVIVSIIK